MWGFMKPLLVKPVCPNQPTQQTIKEIENYRKYILDSIECYYKRILKELSVTDPESLATLDKVIAEYREVEKSIDAKMLQLEETITSFIQLYDTDSIEEMQLQHTYDPMSESLNFFIGKKEDDNG